MRTRLLLVVACLFSSSALLSFSSTASAAARPTCPFVPYGYTCNITCPPNVTQYCNAFFGHFGCYSPGGTCEYDELQCGPFSGCCDAVTGQGCGGSAPYCESHLITCELYQN